MIAISHRWSILFFAAAAFNFLIGIPLMLFPEWAFHLAFVKTADTLDAIAPKLWGDFGFCVALIGVGYAMVAFDLYNRSLVWLGILAKAFDVFTLTYRWSAGIANPIVLLPAAIDALFIAAFIIFLIRTADAKLPGSEVRT
jgi:hypothetical protein